MNTLCTHLLLTISNTSLSIIKLSIDGLDYQAMVLLRNLYETCFTLLNIIIDVDKRKEFFESARKENDNEVWKKHFSMRKMRETIDAYEATLCDNNELNNDELDELREWKSIRYKELSAFAHNSFPNLLLFGYQRVDNPEDIMKPNIWGITSTRAVQILSELDGLLWYTGLVFYKLLLDPKIDVTKESLFNKNSSISHTFWKKACYLRLLTNEYYKYICEAEIEHGD